MSLISYKEWRIRESSPSTRVRDGWARYGSYPPTASVMSRSTPIPFIMDKAMKEFGTPEKPKKRKKKRKSK